jgi:hypothetical protein
MKAALAPYTASMDLILQKLNNLLQRNAQVYGLGYRCMGSIQKKICNDLIL